MIDAYPLCWPAGRPRTPRQNISCSRFSPGNRATETRNVLEEIARLGGQNVVVSTNVKLRRDGLPYASDKAPEDRGVAVYFDYAGRQKCFACDRWETVEENLRAIFKSIEAIRGLDRWGSKDFVDAAFTGFAALPSPERSVKRNWRHVFNWPDGARPDRPSIDTVYRRLARERHPDIEGGSADLMTELNRARQEALEEISS